MLQLVDPLAALDPPGPQLLLGLGDGERSRARRRFGFGRCCGGPVVRFDGLSQRDEANGRERELEEKSLGDRETSPVSLGRPPLRAARSSSRLGAPASRARRSGRRFERTHAGRSFPGNVQSRPGRKSKRAHQQLGGRKAPRAARWGYTSSLWAPEGVAIVRQFTDEELAAFNSRVSFEMKEE